jgi:hypothetical protein
MSYLNKIYNSLTTTDLTAKQTFYGKLSSTPADSDYASGEVALYVKNDGGLYKRPNGGTEALVADGGSSYSLPTDIESGGSAEMSVQGLSGDLAAAQDPKSHNNAAHSTNFASDSHDNAAHSTNFASDSHDNASHSTNFSPNSHDHSSEALGETTPLTSVTTDTASVGTAPSNTDDVARKNETDALDSAKSDKSHRHDGQALGGTTPLTSITTDSLTTKQIESTNQSSLRAGLTNDQSIAAGNNFVTIELDSVSNSAEYDNRGEFDTAAYSATVGGSGIYLIQAQAASAQQSSAGGAPTGADLTIRLFRNGNDIATYRLIKDVSFQFILVGTQIELAAGDTIDVGYRSLNDDDVVSGGGDTYLTMHRIA